MQQLVKCFSTSNSIFNDIKFEIQNNLMIVDFPQKFPLRIMWIEDIAGKHVIEVAPNQHNKVILNLKDLINGFYYINIFISKDNTNTFESYIRAKEIVLQIRDCDSYIKLCPYYFWNLDLIKTSRLYTYHTPLIDNSIDVVGFAKNIVKGANSINEKILRVHNWVAENLYYDRDLLVIPNRCNLSVCEVLRERRCVCQGYIDLSLALLTSIGIKAEGIFCTAINSSNNGGWGNKENRTLDLNHVIIRAFNGDRWVYIDTTWDSANIYENGEKKNLFKIKPSLKYYDVSLQLISSTHKFTPCPNKS